MGDGTVFFFFLGKDHKSSFICTMWNYVLALWKYQMGLFYGFFEISLKL